MLICLTPNLCLLVGWSVQELGQGPDAATCQNLEAGSSLLVALPAALGGLMVLGETQVTYLHPSAGIIKTVALPHPTTMRVRLGVEG
jgi:hypothetical protein